MTPARNAKRSGTALIVSLWVMIILSLLVAAFAFDMIVESGITSYYRKRVKAQYLARAGVEWAKLILVKSTKVKAEDIVPPEEEDLYVKAMNLSRGNAVRGMTKELGQGKIILDIVPEQSRRNVNTLADEDWEEILDQCNVPEELWPSLIDCFADWVDQSDEHRLNGAESDDAFYQEKGYKVKNGPLDTVDELLLIKGFTPAIVYGGPPIHKDDEPMTGIASLLTTYGDGKVNVNTASREVLLTLGIADYTVDDIIRLRDGPDLAAGTKDDGIENLDEIPGLEASVKEKLTTQERKYVRLVSIGEVQKVKSGIWCVLSVDEGGIKPLFWREETMQ